ncbi:MAG: acyltransferase family protein, partial [Actinomycetia bacterium]|nr:acyltransferase family protein [Actinomycetes bacterium]
MGDAEIIPLGARGRPGRGRRETASSAARSLAGRSGRRPSRADADRPAATTSFSTETPARERPAGLPVSDLIDAVAGGAREVFGADWERRLAEWVALLRRRLAGDYHVDEFGFDPELTARLGLAIARPLAEKWFRIEVRGAENIPAQDGVLLVANHSGTVPVDAVMTSLIVHDHAARHLRMLAADLVFTLPFVSEAARKGGATLACSEDAERLLRQGELVGVWPEGFKGIGKPYSERYKLQRFGRGGFVSAAMRTGVPIV